MSTVLPSLSRPQIVVDNPQPGSNTSATSTQRPPLNELKKPPYQAAVQVKFLHLQAEVESLLQHLQNQKQQRLAATSCQQQNWE